MDSFNDVERNDERYILSLRRLFERYGYRRYKMSKFEEYDLYLQNRSFISDEKIFTFTDPSGKLLALKPDITLSIVKSAKAGASPDKVYYCENVYRAPNGAKEVKELMQVGLECIGQLDLYSECEVIALAARSLRLISDECIIGISHMGIIAALLDETKLAGAKKDTLMRLVGDKSAHEIREFCSSNGVDAALTEKLLLLCSLYGSFADTLEAASELAVNEAGESALRELRDIYEMLSDTGCADCLRLDFSIMNDMSYYNGIIFQGFVSDLPRFVLSGGRYDSLIHKLGKNADAIGFAIYLDQLERFHQSKPDFDVDILLVYDDDADIKALTNTALTLTNSGKRVRVQRCANGDFSYRELMQFKDGRLESVEKNA